MPSNRLSLQGWKNHRPPGGGKTGGRTRPAATANQPSAEQLQQYQTLVAQLDKLRQSQMDLLSRFRQSSTQADTPEKSESGQARS